MSEPIEYPLDGSIGSGVVQLKLRRYVGPDGTGSEGRTPVLLLHGGSASFRTFLTPSGAGLARWLFANGCDPWLLDWRGSGLVVDDPANLESLTVNGKQYNFSDAARIDLPRAIGRMRDAAQVQAPIAVLGFCMGGGVVAEAIARGYLEKCGVHRAVLMTLGLFYDTPIDGRMKGEERLLERFQQRRSQSGAAAVLSVDPRFENRGGGIGMRTAWEEELESMYGTWPEALRAHGEGPAPAARANETAVRMCNRLAFMYGLPYAEENLVPEIHGDEAQEGRLPELFGAIPLHMWIHGARNIRRGHATEEGVPDEEFIGDAARERFRRLEKVTLIGGALDRLWHRDSVDRMHEWLCHGPSRYLPRFHKRVFPQYAHQDLLWGKRSPDEVYPTILAGLVDR